MIAIQLENITHRYDGKIILDNLNASIADKKITCLLGNTGSGKTTILRLIAGLEQPASGKIYINNRLVTKGNEICVPPFARKVGFVFQDLALWPHFTVLKNISWTLKVTSHKNAIAEAAALLETFGLAGFENKYPHQLSGGQQQLLAIARAMAPNPEIILMDEPLSNLDKKIKLRMLEKVMEIKEKFNVTIVYVTHDHNEALHIADELIVLNNNGKVEMQGSKKEIAESDNAFLKEFIGVLPNYL